MIRSFVLHDIPITHIAAAERWYYRDHGPEITRRYGPWAARFESYLPVAVPERAQQLGFFNWRVTEGWWNSLPEPGPAGTLAFTPPPAWGRVAPCLTPWQPTEDFLGGALPITGHAALRWVILHKYPETVGVEEGEEWYLHTHVPELIRRPALWRFFSYRTLPQQKLPGHWPPGTGLPNSQLLTGWHRVSELWFDGFDGWEEAIFGASFTPPPWAPDSRFPFLDVGTDFVTTFILERPTDEFLRDGRAYP